MVVFLSCSCQALFIHTLSLCLSFLLIFQNPGEKQEEREDLLKLFTDRSLSCTCCRPIAWANGKMLALCRCTHTHTHISLIIYLSFPSIHLPFAYCSCPCVYLEGSYWSWCCAAACHRRSPSHVWILACVQSPQWVRAIDLNASLSGQPGPLICTCTMLYGVTDT